MTTIRVVELSTGNAYQLEASYKEAIRSMGEWCRPTGRSPQNTPTLEGLLLVAQPEEARQRLWDTLSVGGLNTEFTLSIVNSQTAKLERGTSFLEPVYFDDRVYPNEEILIKIK